MKKAPSLLDQNIQLLQSYYRFLMLGKYVEHTLLSQDFSKDTKDIQIPTGAKSHFGIRTILVKNLLSEMFKNPDKKNIFGYLVEISAFRGIFSSTRELLDNNKEYHDFVSQKLKDQYFAFEQIIKLIRNVLSHTTTASINLKPDDFEKQKDFLVSEKKSIIDFNMKYATYFREWQGASAYGITIKIDFKKLKNGQKLFEIIPLHQLYLLSELCYNMSEVFRIQRLKSPKK